MNPLFYFYLLIVLWVSPFTVKGQGSQSVINDFLNDSAVRTGHAGISIYEPATGKYLYNYNEEKNFIPSSTVKLFTLYAGMKYLGDSVPAMKFAEDDSTLLIYSTGDPTFLHPDFKDQRLFDLLKITPKQIILQNPFFESFAYGAGWSWEDYTEEFMIERSSFPIYGNALRYTQDENRVHFFPKEIREKNNRPSSPWRFNGNLQSGRYYREFHSNNKFKVGKNELRSGNFLLPFITSDSLTLALLGDTLHKIVLDEPDLNSKIYTHAVSRFYSRPVDSLFRPMMFNSDNFFAEQTLLMVSNEKLGYMSDSEIIDSLLSKELKDIPTKPRWVDGSGLSRYNLFSPKDFIYILNKIKKEFGKKRVNNILPAGGQGTLMGYYEKEGDAIHAKSGSMSNNVSLSGYLVTEKKRELVFSVIVNNFSGSGRACRKAIEGFLKEIRRIN